MSPSQRAAVAAACAIAALLSDWVMAELYLRDDSAWNVAGALALNVIVLAVALVALWRWFGERRLTVALRAVALLAAAVLGIGSSRLALGEASLSAPVRVAASLVLLAGALLVAWRAGDAFADRLMRAIAFGSLAFVVTPPLWHWADGRPTTWIAAAPASATPGRSGTVFLLLDELGAAAAEPLVAELRRAGLNVDTQAIAAAAGNTTNAIPSMFAPMPFANARPCGRSTICDGTRAVDFSRLRVLRPDVHVTGLLHPYCDIQGLSSCLQLQQHHDFGNAYRSLLAFWLRRLSPSLADTLRSPLPAGAVRDYLQRQRDFIDASAFWDDGGVLYAHLFLPHPPGLLGATTLDADYAANLGVAAAFVRDLAARAHSHFGERFSLLITSDHPLRASWCPSTYYHAGSCTLRAAFSSDKVPMIVASPRPLLRKRIASNARVFSVLAAELQRSP